MTDAEREVMNTIHLYGRILSLGDGGKETVLKGVEAILKEEQSGDQV